MKINKQFLNMIKEMIQEELSNREPLLESPVPTKGRLLVEGKINRIIKEVKDGSA